MHQTIAGSGGVIIFGDDVAGNFDLRFNRFGVTWNGIPHIPLSDGVATLNCSSVACEVGDSYVLDYRSMVPYGEPSGFGGVLYRLHLEGYINVAPVNLNLEVTVDGSNLQECSQPGGPNVRMTASFNIPAGDQLDSVTWNFDGITTGSELNKFFAVNTVNGLFDTEAVNLQVRDTTDPVITHSYLRKNNLVDGQNGDQFLTLPNATMDIHLLEESLRLDVGARDAYGNVSSKNQTLIIR